jgi:hypothetical protein
VKEYGLKSIKLFVIPAKAGIQRYGNLDSCFRRNDIKKYKIMKIKHILLILSIIVFSNCQDKRHEDKTPEEILTDTPEALEDNTSDYNFSSKRYNPDLISKLYAEALEKNTALKLLDESIKKINSNSLNTRTKPFNKYASTNSEYWTTANQYIRNLNDSLLKHETFTVFQNLESDYKESIAKHEDKLKKIKERTTDLNDKLVLIKLMISQSMIKNYQTNEKPDIQELETLLKQYNDLILKTDQFTKIVK